MLSLECCLIAMKMARLSYNIKVKILYHHTGLNEMVKDKPQEGYVIPGRLLTIEIKEKWSWDLIAYHAGRV